MKKSALVILIVLLSLIGLGYFQYQQLQSGAAESESLSALSTTLSTSLSQQEVDLSEVNQLLSVLDQVSVLSQLNIDIFGSPQYQSLRDFSVTLFPAQIIGRLNPFLEINESTTTTTTPATTTNSPAATGVEPVSFLPAGGNSVQSADVSLASSAGTTPVDTALEGQSSQQYSTESSSDTSIASYTSSDSSDSDDSSLYSSSDSYDSLYDTTDTSSDSSGDTITPDLESGCGESGCGDSFGSALFGDTSSGTGSAEPEQVYDPIDPFTN